MAKFSFKEKLQKLFGTQPNFDEDFFDEMSDVLIESDIGAKLAFELIDKLEKICKENTGITLDKYFRFPEGKYSIESLKCVNNLGYKTIFWSFGYADWDNDNQPSESYAIKKILSNTHNGAVILLHPTSSTNAKILPVLIDAWRDEGYRFGTLDELTR